MVIRQEAPSSLPARVQGRPYRLRWAQCMAAFPPHSEFVLTNASELAGWLGYTAGFSDYLKLARTFGCARSPCPIGLNKMTGCDRCPTVREQEGTEVPRPLHHIAAHHSQQQVRRLPGAEGRLKSRDGHNSVVHPVGWNAPSIRPISCTC